MADGIKNESNVTQGLLQSPGQMDATAPRAAAHPSHQHVRGTGAQPHSEPGNTKFDDCP